MKVLRPERVCGKKALIISPDIFSKIKRQSFSSDTTFSCKPSFQISPKSLKPIYVIAFTIAIFLLPLVNDPVDIAFGSNSSITFPGIRADYGPTSNPLTYQGKQRFGFRDSPLYFILEMI
jgi:hypothetical protein